MCSPYHGYGGKQHDHRCGHLHTACGGAGASSDEHQNHGKELAGFLHGRGIHAVKTCRSGRNCAEKGSQKLFLPAHACEHIILFQQIKKEGSSENQYGCGYQHNFGMQEIFFETQPVPLDIIPYKEAGSAYDDEGHYREIHEDVPFIGYKGAVGFVNPH